MILNFGPAPDQKVIEERPEGVSVEAAVGAWHAGYADARAERDYHVFPEDAQDLQPLYSDGLERGERDRLHMKRINERLPEEPKEVAAEPEKPRSRYRVRRFAAPLAAVLKAETTVPLWLYLALLAGFVTIAGLLP